MRNEHPIRREALAAAVLTAVLTFIGAGTVVSLAGPPYLVSQKGRAFQPAYLAIRRGETVQVVNDDGDLLHHAYIDSERFRFDSGDQEPGSKTSITFPVAGTFNVLCAIHPKMKLVVHVD
jgi:plastocyanin